MGEGGGGKKGGKGGRGGRLLTVMELSPRIEMILSLG